MILQALGLIRGINRKSKILLEDDLILSNPGFVVLLASPSLAYKSTNSRFYVSILIITTVRAIVKP
ncbi:MAG: hypothetical protein KME28_19870 [Pelatocladus maniniholoensis HA4357-MV3]|jgi:hypothetical protein|uniref:Uncharacterized protein n=1 Tax=Pelatocladus maniniholoensis HA4357-MV3 TaxID=1117104 RepID=A0A9E3LUR8_9NOST|nr:hypothetical protein [Pelatocladus maniniholoensis HA4357-MV3]BAZ68708.1 hypothetical protein NIES4106_34740 [Fischerella sp. NIES-4106]